MIAAMVCCGRRDERMLSLFAQRWQELYPNVQLWLANDANDPVTICHDLPTVSMRWDYNGASNIISAMLEIGADIVAKLDVDCWHLTDGFFEPFDDEKIMAVGMQWRERPNRFLGVAYALRRSAMIDMDAQGLLCGDKGGEDVTVCDAVRTIHPNGVYLHRNALLRRSDTYEGSGAMMVHCGLYGREQSSRDLALREMVFMRDNMPLRKSCEKVYVCLTTIPSRLHHIKSIVARILASRHQPEMVVVSIPYVCKRMGETYDEELIAGIAEIATVHRCDDNGAMTKWIGACEFIEDPQATMIIVDDDMKYSPQLIERMLAEYKGGLLANSVIEMDGVKIAEAYAGIMVRRGEIDLAKITDLEFALCDDLRISTIGTPIHKMTAPVFADPLRHSDDNDSLKNFQGGNLNRYKKLIKKQHERTV